jgi:predicted O-methyltransferase YrrM
MFNFQNKTKNYDLVKKTIIEKYNNIKKYGFINNRLKEEINILIKKTKQIINEHLLPIIKSTNEKLEGNIFMFHETTEYTNEFLDKQINFILALKRKNINNILEIGFNAGFSALLMLLTNPNVNLTCVDICMHNYSMLCYKKLNELFGNRIKLIPGSSVDIVPTLTDKYDLIHIDGCHLVDIAEKDIQNSLQLCKTGTILIMDDTNGDELYNLWMNYCKKYNLLSFFPNNFVMTRYHDIKCYP